MIIINFLSNLLNFIFQFLYWFSDLAVLLFINVCYSMVYLWPALDDCTNKPQLILYQELNMFHPNVTEAQHVYSTIDLEYFKADPNFIRIFIFSSKFIYSRQINCAFSQTFLTGSKKIILVPTNLFCLFDVCSCFFSVLSMAINCLDAFLYRTETQKGKKCV